MIATQYSVSFPVRSIFRIRIITSTELVLSELS